MVGPFAELYAVTTSRQTMLLSAAESLDEGRAVATYSMPARPSIRLHGSSGKSSRSYFRQPRGLALAVGHLQWHPSSDNTLVLLSPYKEESIVLARHRGKFLALTRSASALSTRLHFSFREVSLGCSRTRAHCPDQQMLPTQSQWRCRSGLLFRLLLDLGPMNWA